MGVFQCMVEAQGGDLDDFRRRSPAPVRREVRAERSGILAGPSALAVGEAVRSLGGGRYATDDGIDPRVGWQSLVEPSARIADGQTVGVVHAADEASAEAAARRIRDSLVWDAEAVADLVLEVL
jgi:thymidine phosphorylase